MTGPASRRGEEHIRVETQGEARVITLCRPHKKNALSRRTVELLALAIEQAAADRAVRAIILAAEGDVFMAGGDLSEFASFLDDPKAPDTVISMGARMSKIETCAVPVIAAVTGDVYGGGCELVLLCDFVIAEEQAGFSFRHVQMGLSPAWGGARRLLERVGPLHANRLLLTAQRIDADEALLLGLTTAVVPEGIALDASRVLVEHIAKSDRDVVTENKRVLAATRAVMQDASAKIEADAFRSLWGGPAHRAAMDRARARAKR